MMHVKGIKKVHVLLLSGAALAALPATAQEAMLEEIVVTAQKRQQNLQDVPVSITALSGDALLDQGVANVQDLGKLTPGLQITSTDAAANPKIFIRGIGLADFNANASGAVGIYLDGAYVASPLAQTGQFFDLAQIEVLKGPQGTLYGRNSTGGAINVTTRRPDFDTSGEGQISYGRYNAVTLQAASNAPIVADRLAMRIAGIYERDDGRTYNRVTDDDVNRTKRWAGRASFLLTPTDGFEAVLQIHGGQNRGDSLYSQSRALIPTSAAAAGPDGLCARGAAPGACVDALGYADTDNDPYAGDYNLKGQDRIDLYGATLNLRWDLGGARLYSITAYDHAKRNNAEDTDASPNQLMEASYRATQRDFSQELRLEGEWDRAKLVGGLYYLHDYLNTAGQYDVLRAMRPMFTTPDNPTGVSIENNVATVGFPYRQTTDSYAGFGQVDFQATDRLTLTAGLRYSRDEKDFHYRSTVEQAIELFSLDASKSFESVSGRLAASLKLTDDAMAYASYNRGYKSGGFFGGYTRDPADLAPYDDETLDAYEIGGKTEWLNRRLRLNLSGFFYNYQDLQVFQLIQRGGLPVQTFTNAASAHIWGSEFELTALPVAGLELGLSGAFLDAKYRDFISQGENMDGNRLPSSPRWSLTGTVSHRQQVEGVGELALTANLSYRSKVYFNSRNLERLSQKGYWLADLTLGWTASDGGIGAGVTVANLLNKDYAVDIANYDSFGLDAVNYGRPRRVSAYLRWTY